MDVKLVELGVVIVSGLFVYNVAIVIVGKPLAVVVVIVPNSSLLIPAAPLVGVGEAISMMSKVYEVCKDNWEALNGPGLLIIQT